MARPWKYNRNVADRIIVMVSNGMALLESCRRLRVARGTVCGWAAENVDDFGTRLRRARDAAYIALEDDVLTRSREARGGDMAHVAACKLETDTAKWLLARRHAQYFGDRIEHQYNIEGHVELYLPDKRRTVPGDDAVLINGQAQLESDGASDSESAVQPPENGGKPPFFKGGSSS